MRNCGGGWRRGMAKGGERSAEDPTEAGDTNLRCTNP